MESATLPVQMIEPERRRIRDLRRGESGYVIFTALRANDRGECFLDTSDWLRKGDGFETLQVRRDEKGFHVVVPSDLQVLRLKRGYRIAFFFSSARVASVTVGGARKG
jgi:hypothetical protein